jgi:hypothetical protein
MRKVIFDDGFCYFVSGENPRLMMHTGTHGDEYSVIEIVKNAIEKYKNRLPDFIFVPEVSPSAVANKMRVNWASRDMNRSFFAHLDDPEVKANIEVLKNRHFDLFVSFHEDHEFENEYYVYDVGRDRKENVLVLKHNQVLRESGIRLLNRVDAPEDPNLGFMFVDGYKKFEHKNDTDHGIAGWIMDTKIAEEYLMPEIPMKADIKTKEMIVDTFFEEIIVKYSYR